MFTEVAIMWQSLIPPASNDPPKRADRKPRAPSVIGLFLRRLARFWGKVIFFMVRCLASPVTGDWVLALAWLRRRPSRYGTGIDWCPACRCFVHTVVKRVDITKPEHAVPHGVRGVKQILEQDEVRLSWLSVFLLVYLFLGLPLLVVSELSLAPRWVWVPWLGLLAASVPGVLRYFRASEREIVRCKTCQHLLRVWRVW